MIKFYNKGITLVLALLLAFGGFSGLIAGAGKVHAAASDFAGGSGTESDPYEIATATQLDSVRYHMEAGNYFKLTADIDLSGYPNWDPIGYVVFTGYGWDEQRFYGNIDGNGFKIMNLTMDRDSNNVGLFGITQGGVISNMILDNVNVTGQRSDQTSSGIGSLVGSNGGIIRNSYVTGTGGVIGKGLSSTVGGLAGFNSGTILNSHTTVNVTGLQQVGGLVGQNDGPISQSYATGAVLGQYDAIHGRVGGLVGINNQSITNSYAAGNVTGSGPDVGGLVGMNSGYWGGRIINSYSTGTVVGGAGLSSSTGGLVGGNYAAGEPVITNSFYNATTSGQSDTDRGDGKTTADMQTQSTFSGWDFDTVWYALPGQYPQLWKGELAPGTDAGTTKLDNAIGMEYSFDGVDYDAVSGASVDNLALNVGDVIYIRNVETPLLVKALTVGLADLKPAAVSLTEIAGVTAPVTGETPVVTLADTSEYTAAISWSPVDEAFEPNTIYTATITLTAKPGYTLTGVAEDAFTVDGAVASNDADSGVITAVFPMTSAYEINAKNIVLAGPATDATPVTSIDMAQFTGTVSWLPLPVNNVFQPDVAYIATITLMAKEGYTLDGVNEDSFTVNGEAATNAANSGIVTAVFPKTNAYVIEGQEIVGVKAPVSGQTPVSSIAATDAYSATISWSPETEDGVFEPSTSYTATITLHPKAGYTLEGVEENAFTVGGAEAINDVDSGVITAVFPETEAYVVNEPTIAGVTLPVTGSNPADSIAATDQYTATISWSPDDEAFGPSTVYTATITLLPKTGYTLEGVAEDFFTVEGATTTTNDADSGVITAVFPSTEALSSDATLTSTIGTVSAGGTAHETITNIPYGTTAAALKLAITPAEHATYELYKDDGVTVATTVSSGYRVIVTAQDGESQVTYILTVNAGPSSGGGGGGIPTTPSDDKATSKDGTLTVPKGKAGEVSLGDEVTVAIPANATSKDLQITVKKLLDTQDLIGQEILASPIYEILKNFTENFDNPVTITFVFDSSKLKSNQKVSVFYYDEVKKIWVKVPGGKINGNEITVDVSHFTKFAVLAEDVPASVTDFSDIAGHWAMANIKQAVSAGIVNGYEDGTFRPNATITRAEFAVMLMNALQPQEEGNALTFTDTAKIGTWAQKAIAQAVHAGYLKGYKDGTFRPDAEITRAEMAVILANVSAQAIEAAAKTGFADDKDIPAWAKGSVAYAKQQGLMRGDGDNRFAPQAHATRAEAVTVLLNLLAQENL